jgi:exodeoxyribonuclease VII small subunit
MMAEKKFEEAMERLEEIVQSLESSDLSLEDSLAVFEEGFCSKKLEEAEEKVNMLVKEGDGKYTQQPFEMESKDET